MKLLAPAAVRRTLSVVALAAALLLPTGCAGSAPGTLDAADVVAAPSLQPGAALPVPTDAPLLTLTGHIAATNEGAALALDAGILDRLGLVRVTVFDPWAKTDLQVQGVWLADVIDVARVDGAAQSLHVTALDDYQIDLPMADVRAGGIMLATRAGDGSAIPTNAGGPTRLVFTGNGADNSRPELWIWSLKTIDVR